MQMQLLRERLLNMEQRQQKMMSSVAQVLQKPGLAINLTPQLETNDRKRRLPRIAYLYDEAGIEDSQTGNYLIARENTNFALSSNIEPFEQLESSMVFWENVLNIDAQPKSPGIDMNSEPAPVVTSEPITEKEQPARTTEPPRAGVNDMFWEQFLTENPGSTETQEVQLERKDSDARKNESKPGDQRRFWWNMNNVNNLAEQMGHLTPAEGT
ncbi:heat stress transcription factor A-4a-like [Hibiscus syriacus]|uniref:heat stress transcription factor A-4a-like n=1 Tax=Hibiscus syriacus TaxID=106335 RepID=UPI0019224323|nr:heat stress transcription factor A-4a-like [Hibiscus syriacus]